MKLIKKHWGHEIWIEDGSSTPFAVKRILFLAGNRTSLQVHRYKVETNYVLSGKGKVVISAEPLDIDAFLTEAWTLDQIKLYELNCSVIKLEPNVHFSIQPGYVHRVYAETDLEFIEVSTTELDDVIRLHDDQARGHGKILSEHQ